MTAAPPDPLQASCVVVLWCFAAGEKQQQEQEEQEQGEEQGEKQEQGQEEEKEEKEEEENDAYARVCLFVLHIKPFHTSSRPRSCC